MKSTTSASCYKSTKTFVTLSHSPLANYASTRFSCLIPTTRFFAPKTITICLHTHHDSALIATHTPETLPNKSNPICTPLRIRDTPTQTIAMLKKQKKSLEDIVHSQEGLIMKVGMVYGDVM